MRQNSHYSAEWTANYYKNYTDKEWTRLVSRPTDRVRLYIHSHYLRRFVKPGSHVLEVGAGPGRVTQILANLGCRIWVTDLSEIQLKLHKKYAEEFGFDAAEMKQAREAISKWVRVHSCLYRSNSNALINHD
ncbi:MAG: class I SAM-dependent methyltransferase [Anaerolineae bacterium]|nr:class I SAM-dependent methyltransferase [Anaerolineae bacterium]